MFPVLSIEKIGGGGVGAGKGGGAKTTTESRILPHLPSDA